MDVELEKVKTEQLNVVLAYILWWFLGVFGVHRFYTGQSKGWLYIVLFIVGIITMFFVVGYFILIGLGIWWIIDGIKLNKVVKEYNLNLLNNYQRQNS
ncbi:MAG: TM2 domain-containing protein [Arcobacteraceae bacterium]